jgi:23S rRNA (cytosine1962-C5)-methyltransferase
MLLETPQNFSNFELLDTGEGLRLEKWGDVVLKRPDPQIIWEKTNPAEWEKVWASFESGKNGESGKWVIKKPLPKPWIINFQNIKFSLKPSPFKHVGLFAEQAAQWDWMSKIVSKHKFSGKPKILNLFAYTGGATMVLAKAGCFVTHVDASKPSITWANVNQKLNSLPENSMRWILDDAAKFVKRELKRNSKYDGIIMDPPAFGHSPDGKVWKFNQDLPGLLTDCVGLLSNEAAFLLINGYATNSSALSLNNLLEDKIRSRTGKIESGELCLKQKFNPVRPERFYGADRIISTGIFSRWQAQG